MIFFCFFQAYVGCGLNLSLSFLSNAWSDSPEDKTPTREFVDFDKESGKVSSFYVLSPFVHSQKIGKMKKAVQESRIVHGIEIDL